MLQQTRVEAVRPFYERWLARFPDVAALAVAEEEEVLRYWAGLGYYRRARMLHAAARRVVAAGGELPRSRAGWRELPGVGEYTSAAIASIAFGEAVPVVDGNVKRLAARFLALELAADDRALHRKAEEWAGQLVVAAPAPGDLNQALMELGATVCTPRAADCEHCPLVGACASTGGDPLARPLPTRRPRWREVRLEHRLARRDGRVLLVQCRESGWTPGLWEPPRLAVGEDRSGLIPLGTVRHVISRHRIEATAFLDPGWDGSGGVDPERVPLSGLGRKLLGLLDRA
ncbi:MAG: A/G-specific adenine glycosylase [Planctomycetota bacterium]|nr:MAG: A/G-specific adenine glycosylase [Planctomycetota bacterium]